MTSFLLTISFILHFIMILIALFLIGHIRQLKQNESKIKSDKREIEELLSSYLMELQEENEKFLNIINKSEQNNKKVKNQPINSNNGVAYNPPMQTQQSLHKMEEKKKEDNNASSESKLNDKSKESNREYVPPDPEPDVDYVQSEEAQIFSLHNQGYSSEEIAKKLNKGKTEIELLLKFRQES